MAEINKQLIAESEKEEQKEDVNKEEKAMKRTEENLKRLREFERHLKEAPRFTFNTNVCKKGVIFAQSEIDSGEIAKDEALV